MERVEVKLFLQEGKGSVTDGTQLRIRDGGGKTPMI